MEDIQLTKQKAIIWEEIDGMKTIPEQTNVERIIEGVICCDRCIIHPCGCLIHVDPNKKQMIHNTFHKWYNKVPAIKGSNSLVKILKGSYISLIQVYNYAFQHITFDTLPKIPLIKQIIEREPRVKVLVMNKLQGDLVSKFGGIDRSRIVIAEENKTYVVDRGYYIHWTQMNKGLKMGHSRPLALNSYLKTESDLNSVVYISRRGANMRDVQNEQQLLRIIYDAIKGTNYELKYYINPKQPQVIQDVMKRCKVFISPHGGAVGNMMWMSKGGQVMEFIPSKMLNERPCYYYLAQSLGLSYHRVNTKRFNFNQGKMVVDEQNFKQILGKIL